MHRTPRRPLVVACLALACAGAAPAAAQDRGIDPNQGQSLVEVTLPDKGAAMRLQLEAADLGVEFNDHYLRRNDNGTVTVSVFGTDFDRLRDAGYKVGHVIEGPETWEAREAASEAAQEAEADASAAATDVTPADDGELVVLRVDYFQNYDGRFLSVEAKTRKAAITPATGAYTGPTLSLSWNKGAGTEIDAVPRTMNLNIDTDTTPDTYIEHRELVRIGEPGSSDPPTPTRIRIGSSTGEAIEAPVEVWLGGGLPPMSQKYISDFTTDYMDPTQVYDRFRDLAAEFPDLAELIDLPHKTNGYQRRAQANMAGTTQPGNSPAGTLQSGTVVLTSRQWGHLPGGNDLTARFVNPGEPNRALAVSVENGKDLVVSLATNGSGALISTAAQVVAAINGHVDASELLVATTYRNNAGAGTVLARAKVGLSDFLNAPASVPRGPFEYQVMRIGKKRDGKKVGVFLYCQQHAREWATPLTCLETAEQLLRNYTLDGHVRELVNNLDIFILPSSNPDGAHYSRYDFNMQRRNLTNHCVEGGKSDSNPFAANFWAPRSNPSTGALYSNNDPSSRNLWGVDLNRNNTFGTLFDGFIGASYNCNNDTYTGPAEASEPEIQNELWIADTFTNIKFSNNIHSYGGYFMWAPGAYKPDRSEGEAVHANIGVEKYFFAAGDKILNRIKEVRNTAILPERTGPIADVLYSASGNSADEHWYNRGVIAYSFETGADRFGFPVLSVAANAGATGIRASTRTVFSAGDTIKIEPGTANEETVTVESITPTNGTSPAPNVILTAPLQKSHPAGSVLRGGVGQVAVGFQPDYASEGKYEALEFAAGNIGLLESAFDYANDVTAPTVTMTGSQTSKTPVVTTFEWSEPAVIRYTTDGSTPTDASKAWDSTGPREPGESFRVSSTTTFKWKATDIKGNASFGSKKFVITK